MNKQDQTISRRDDKIKEIVTRIVALADHDLENAINHFRIQLGYSDRKIAKILNISYTTISKRFPRDKQEVSHES